MAAPPSGMEAVFAAALEREKSEVDPRTLAVKKVVISSDLSDAEQKQVMNIAQAAYTRLVLAPTRSSWRKDTNDDPMWSRRMLEREVERTSLRDLCLAIKQELDASMGPLWHVIYGRAFAAVVGYEAGSFIHFTIEGAEVVAFRHGK